MEATYRLNANELSLKWLHSIKEAFQGKDIEITVSESIDETEYLFSSETNKKELLESIRQLEEGKGITMSVEELHQKFGM